MMNIDVPQITTKLHIPASRSASLSRPRLHRKLDRCSEVKLTVIAAPAGFGKTTLLVEWSETSHWPLAWVSLDRADNDPVRFWSYVVAALDKLDARVSENVLQFIHTPSPSPVEYLVPTLINTVAAITDHFVLVLDDYHCIESDNIQQSIAYLLDYMPPNMHLLLATRRIPALPLARWRARGQLVELNAADLRFSADETQRLLNDILSLDLTEDVLNALQSRTEGWAVGLHLAALAIERQPAKTPIEAFEGDRRHVVDYLGTEVMQQLSRETRRFLLQTSILDTLNPSLCDAVCHGTAATTSRATGIEQIDSQAMLDDLYRRQLFVTSRSGKGDYCYHPLFAAFLRDQLRRDATLDRSTLHLRAAAWYEGHHNVEHAIDHALAANDVQRASQLIAQTGRAHLIRGEFVTLLNWFRALPDAAIRHRPLFCVLYAWILTNTGQIKEAETYLDRLEATLSDDVDQARLLGEAATVRARIAVMRGDTAQNIHFSQRALDLLPQDASILRGDAYLNMSFALRDQYAWQAAQDTFEKAIDLSRQTGNLRTATMALYYLGDTHLIQGQFQRAARWYQRGLQWCRTGQTTDTLSPVACWVLTGLGQLLYEWNDLPQAVEHLRQAVELAQQSGEIKVLIYPRITLSYALQALGYAREALAALDEAGRIAEQMHSADFAYQINLARIVIWLNSSQEDKAATWLKQHGVSVENDALTHCEWAMLACQHLHLTGRTNTNSLNAIVSFFQGERRAASDSGRHWHEVQQLVILALAYDALGQRTSARECLAEALSLAEPMDLVRTFVDRGLPIAGLLRSLADRKRRAPYLNKLLAALEPATARRPFVTSVLPARPRSSLIEPLRPREVEILGHVADGRSNKEIADEMIMAVSTVKWYLRNIYGKLDVNRRTQALARARELNLL